MIRHSGSSRQKGHTTSFFLRLPAVVCWVVLAATPTSQSQDRSGAPDAQRRFFSGPVLVEQGLLLGVPGSDPSVTAFKGVPYAAPPLGKLRWHAPVAPEHWEGLRKADGFCANCTQEMRKELGPWTPEYQPQGAVGEDCLYLNIWTAAPSPDDRRPVVVYLPGGAFTGGSGNVPVYNGEGLAKRGLVVVTVNYRVSVLGFLAHPELTRESENHTSGNYGLLDQVAALLWVRKNIAAFGGDSTRVTIMGQSAGAMSVHCLISSPLAKRLFVRAIAQSGFGMQAGPWENLAAAEGTGARFAEAKGAASLAALRAMPAQELMAPVKGEFHFLPIVDGWFLPKRMDELLSAGEQNDVPTLTGWVADEGSFNDDYGRVPADEFRNQVEKQAGVNADQILRLYPSSTPSEAAESQKSLARDGYLVSESLWASRHSAIYKSQIYTYLFTHMQPGATKDHYLAFHSSELPYVFNNLNQSNRPWTPEDQKIAETMSTYWVNFIASGDPNGKGLPEWPAFDRAHMVTMELGDRMGPRPIASQEKLDALMKMLRSTLH
jgi:para-nitrobenzyl esterase